MKLVGIVGSAAEVSYNRYLLQFMARRFHDLAEIELIEIKDIPLFNQSDDQTDTPLIQQLNHKIEQADGVIIATPEHNHTIPAGLKSVLEWLSFKIHPLANKPVMVVGASYYDQGSSRAQLHLRQVLDAPGVNAMVFPGNEFLLGKVKEAFDDEYNLKDEKTVGFLQATLEKFLKFVQIVSGLEEKQPVKMPAEDLYSTGKVATTIEGVDMLAEDWVEQAAAKVHAAEGTDYVKLNRGVLTVDQLNSFLCSMPIELTFVDGNNQFLYYNPIAPAEDMLASRKPSQVGNPMAACHPEKAFKGVEWVIQQLRSGKQKSICVHVPIGDSTKFVIHNYQAMYDEAGEYTGINEMILDLNPIVDWYLKQTGQELSISLAMETDATSGASENEHKADTTSGASEHE